jgi:outer membrane protein assembly factor BamB
LHAITIRCPTCNAALHVGETVTSVVCTYCHTPCRIQQRTRIFQMPRPLVGPPSMPVARTPVRAAPMIVAGVAASVALMGAMSAFLFVGTASYTPPSSLASGSTAEAPAPEPPKEHYQWTSGKPLLRDLDGDGESDLIGMIRVFANSKQLHFLAAYSGATGQALWRTEALPAPLDGQSRIAVAGEHLLVWSQDGKLHGYQLGGGASSWIAELGEKVAELCEGPYAGAVRVITADDRARDVRLSTGELADVEPVSRRKLYAACRAIPNDNNHSYGQLISDSWRRLPNVRGMSSSAMVKRGELTIVAGGKSPGTAVPMLARLDGKDVKWKVELPSKDPLTSMFDEKILYVDERVVLATYRTQFGSDGETFVVALHPDDGRRLWESSFSTGPGSIVMSGVLATEKRAIAVTWTAAVAFDLATGKLSFVIGS